MDGLTDWWDSVELWLAQLWFPLQFALVVAVLAPLCVGAAWVIDRAVGRVYGWLKSGRQD
ncbi:hypothetical protein [Amycolatopsis suaedae]|uniref:Uncharacterized protein n=1 Tax=Amycolatopsis suaedae TaxID=2510978 RepID=A0A4Q7J333_9PSEU|nr:hypothetical protein [Amycolatopsis suaedae]RZQ60394.1 hypothetical protein EWH70_29275 [Amycolatopsis suaedae]